MFTVSIFFKKQNQLVITSSTEKLFDLSRSYSSIKPPSGASSKQLMLCQSDSIETGPTQLNPFLIIVCDECNALLWSHLLYDLCSNVGRERLAAWLLHFS